MNKILTHIVAAFLSLIGGVACGLFAGFFFWASSDETPEGNNPLGNEAENYQFGLSVASDDLDDSKKRPGPNEVASSSSSPNLTKPKKMTPREMMIALSQASNDPNPISRAAVFSNLLANLNENNVESILEVYENMPMGFENMHEYRLLLYAWGKFDAPGAIEYINSRNLGMRGRFVATGALEGWASQDPQAAIQWIKEQDDPRAASIYNFGVVRGWASHDVAGAADYVTNLEEGWEKGRMVGMLTSQFLKEGFPSARQWAETLEDEGVKASAFRNLSRQQARDNPDQVAAWLKEHAGKEYSDGSFEELGENWGRRDPTAAIKYFEDLPEGEGRRQGMLEVVEEWSRKDTEAVGNWLNDRMQADKPLPELDEAMGEYAREVSRENAADAMQWATAIEDVELKEKTITRVGQNWMRQDEEAVKAWLPTSNLAEEVQKAIVTPPQDERRWGGGPPRGPR